MRIPYDCLTGLTFTVQMFNRLPRNVLFGLLYLSVDTPLLVTLSICMCASHRQKWMHYRFYFIFYFRMCDIVAYSGCLLMNQSEKNTHIHKVEKKKNEKLKCSKRVFASAYKCVCLHVCVKCTAHPSIHPSIESNTKMV